MLRLAAQGLKESTAELRYDLSIFFSAVPGAIFTLNDRDHTHHPNVDVASRCDIKDLGSLWVETSDGASATSGSPICDRTKISRN